VGNGELVVPISSRACAPTHNSFSGFAAHVLKHQDNHPENFRTEHVQWKMVNIRKSQQFVDFSQNMQKSSVKKFDDWE